MPIRPARSSRAKSEKLANICSKYNQDNVPREMAVSCWNAVLYLMKEVNIIPEKKHDAILRATTPNEYLELFPPECPTVLGYDKFSAIPRGSLVGFFKQRDNAPYLAHAMIYVGGGRAMGLNNGAIGQSPAWTELNLSSPDVANWGDNPSFSYVEVGGNRRQTVTVRYRDLDDMHRVQCRIM